MKVVTAIRSEADWCRCWERVLQRTEKYHQFIDYLDVIIAIDCSFGFVR